MKLKAPQISLFQACILVFLAIMTTCAVCSTVAIVKAANKPVKQIVQTADKPVKQAEASSARPRNTIPGVNDDDISSELNGIRQNISKVSSELSDIYLQLRETNEKLGFIDKSIESSKTTGASDIIASGSTGADISRVISALNGISNELSGINTTLMMLRR